MLCFGANCSTHPSTNLRTWRVARASGFLILAICQRRLRRGASRIANTIRCNSCTTLDTKLSFHVGPHRGSLWLVEGFLRQDSRLRTATRQISRQETMQNESMSSSTPLAMPASCPCHQQQSGISRQVSRAVRDGTSKGKTCRALQSQHATQALRQYLLTQAQSLSKTWDTETRKHNENCDVLATATKDGFAPSELQGGLCPIQPPPPRRPWALRGSRIAKGACFGAGCRHPSG